MDWIEHCSRRRAAFKLLKELVIACNRLSADLCWAGHATSHTLHSIVATLILYQYVCVTSTLDCSLGRLENLPIKYRLPINNPSCDGASLVPFCTTAANLTTNRNRQYCLSASMRALRHNINLLCADPFTAKLSPFDRRPTNVTFLTHRLRPCRTCLVKELYPLPSSGPFLV